jgi:uncharacterized phage-like protein YoqJ
MDHPLVTPGALTIAITGHRPKDLVTAAGVPIALAPAIADFLARAAGRARALGCARVRVITGGACGVDQAVAEMVSATKQHPGEIAFESVIVLPFPVEILGARWSPADRERLAGLVAIADEVRGPLMERYAVWGLHARNEAMVDGADVLVAFWNGKRSGGTYACLRYALTRARPPRPAWNALAGFASLSLADLGLAPTRRRATGADPQKDGTVPRKEDRP